MTDAVAADPERSPRPKRGTFGRYSLWLAQALIVLALIDGFADLSYPTARLTYPIARAVWHKARPPAAEVPSRAAGWADYRERSVPGLGMIVEPAAGQGLNVDALGIRATGTPRRNGARGVLLGSSQAFGHYVAEDATLAAALERIRKDINVAIIAGPARTTAESIMNWQHVSDKIDAPDFAIFLFSNIDLYRACQPSPPPQELAGQKPALLWIPSRIFSRARPISLKPPCSTPEARTAAVERALYELRAAIAFGRKQSPDFVVVIAPLLYGNESNAALLRAPLDMKLVDSLDFAVNEFRTRIAEENLPEVMDLSAAFDGNGDTYFSDSSSHFSRAGADVLAARMIERLPDTFFEARR